jgi:hypothetical protein
MTAPNPSRNLFVFPSSGASLRIGAVLGLASTGLFAIACGSRTGLAGPVDASVEDCSSDETVLLASGQDHPLGIAVDTTAVYWVDQGLCSDTGCTGTVMKISKCGGTATTLASGQSPYTLAINATTAFWDGLGEVLSVPLAGGTVTTVVSNARSIGPNALALYGESLYWTNNNAPAAVMTVGLDGGAPITLATSAAPERDFSSFLAVDSTGVYWTTDPYLGFHGPTTLTRKPLLGGPPTTLVSRDGGCGGVVLEATRLYWSCEHTVLTVSLDSGEVGTLLTDDGGGFITFIAVDSKSIYWTNFQTGTVKKSSLDGGTPATLAEGQEYPEFLTQDDKSLYWVNLGVCRSDGGCPGTGMIVKSPK